MFVAVSTPFTMSIIEAVTSTCMWQRVVNMETKLHHTVGHFALIQSSPWGYNGSLALAAVVWEGISDAETTASVREAAKAVNKL